MLSGLLVVARQSRKLASKMPLSLAKGGGGGVGAGGGVQGFGIWWLGEGSLRPCCSSAVSCKGPGNKSIAHLIDSGFWISVGFGT